MMKIFVTGVQGALGHAVAGILQSERVDYLGADLPELDITDFKKTHKTLCEYRPDVILHFAAVNDVDGCEKNRETALRVNSLSCLALATIASNIGAKMLYTSTNFVFDGNTKEPYSENSQPNPLNEYGRTKLLGEKHVQAVCPAHFIVRTSWLFSRRSKTYISRFLTMREKPASINVIGDQQASFTYVEHLARAILDIIKTDNYGIFHVVNKGVGSWLDFANRAREIMRFSTEIRPIKLQQLNLLAKRPLYSPLASTNYEAVASFKMPSWQEALAHFIKDLSGEA